MEPKCAYMESKGEGRLSTTWGNARLGGGVKKVRREESGKGRKECWLKREEMMEDHEKRGELEIK